MFSRPGIFKWREINFAGKVWIWKTGMGGCGSYLSSTPATIMIILGSFELRAKREKDFFIHQTILVWMGWWWASSHRGSRCLPSVAASLSVSLLPRVGRWILDSILQILQSRADTIPSEYCSEYCSEEVSQHSRWLLFTKPRKRRAEKLGPACMLLLYF